MLWKSCFYKQIDEYRKSIKRTVDIIENKDNKVDNNLKYSLIGLYLVFVFLTILYFPIDFSMNRAPNGHLAWNWLDFPTFIIFIWLSFILGLILYQKLYAEFIIYSVIIVSIYYTYYKTNTWGSLWCWIANILALKLIVQVFLKNYSSNYLLFEPKLK